jgi:hypothetical protein
LESREKIQGIEGKKKILNEWKMSSSRKMSAFGEIWKERTKKFQRMSNPWQPGFLKR